MNPPLNSYPESVSSADWNRILPGENESVFTRWMYSRHHEVLGALDAGALIVPPGQTGGHALIYAVWQRDFGLLRELLKHGCDPNQLGFTAASEEPSTALDAIADSYHDGDGKFDEMVLDAMFALVREHGGKYVGEHSEITCEPNPQYNILWPERLPDQVAIIRKLIGTGDRNVAAPYAESLSAHFGRKNKKRTEQIEGILETLKGLGQL